MGKISNVKGKNGINYVMHCLLALPYICSQNFQQGCFNQRIWWNMMLELLNGLKMNENRFLMENV